MNKKDFYPMGVALYGMGFLMVDDAGKIKQLYAAIFYAHHGGLVSDINQEIAARKMRPMTRHELGSFFQCHKLSFQYSSEPTHFLVTASQDIKKKEGENKSILPGVWKENEEIKFGDVILNNVDENEIFIPDHAWMILAIDESKAIDNL